MPHLTRRRLALALGGLPLLTALPGTARDLTEAPQDALSRALPAIERRLDARLGVHVLDTQTGRQWAHRAHERFPMCSTFKLLACAAVLARVDAGAEDLDRRIRFGAGDLVTYSPVTGPHADGAGLRLAELCEAAMTHSDNTAANLILRSLGGPAAVTAFARSLGDGTTRLDRWETALNEARPGDARDTTSPAAMGGNLHALLLGRHLGSASREQLTRWLLDNRTGDARLRAGLPAAWRIGDKTGSGDFGTANDVAVIWPPGRAPVIASVYITQAGASFEARNAAIADIARQLPEVLMG
ncbi:class A beta-lactamase [uncultured Azohydromonas sp.]|jgi:Beta-lactamase class A|uniref:class A beta-lactamase n=1 Tax=uncultured Azohydromonas sp. TaxID=487342 RepID=UPI00262C3730|nr:class A beta-lactamase [uncultured Azohydromonas sp.]